MVVVVETLEEVKLEFDSSVAGSEMAGVVVVVVVVVGAAIATVGAIISVGPVVSAVVAIAVGTVVGVGAGVLIVDVATDGPKAPDISCAAALSPDPPPAVESSGWESS